MASYAKSIDYALGATGPAFVMFVKRPDGTGVTATGASGGRFYLYDYDTGLYVADESQTGVTIEADDPLEIKRVIQLSDTVSEIKNGAAWFVYTVGGKYEYTTVVVFTVTPPYKRPTN